MIGVSFRGEGWAKGEGREKANTRTDGFETRELNQET